MFVNKNKLLIPLLIALILLFSQSNICWAYDFSDKECQRDNRPGLWWFRQSDGNLFNNSKPTIIFIHGASGSSSDVNSTKWPLGEFINSGWNVAAFSWSDNNTPQGAIAGPDCKATQLEREIMSIVLENGYDNNEIRFVGYSWGIFPSSFAAKKVLNDIRINYKNILVTVDGVEPVPSNYWLIDDEGYSNYGDQMVGHYLEWVATHQVAPVKPGKKLYQVVYCYGNYSWSGLPWSDFKHCVAPQIRDDLEEAESGYNFYDSKTWNHSNGYRLYTDCILLNHRESRYGTTTGI